MFVISVLRPQVYCLQDYCGGSSDAMDVVEMSDGSSAFGSDLRMVNYNYFIFWPKSAKKYVQVHTSVLFDER